ncbi:tyrosine--tRNA ligase [Paracoccaceae bacterium]|nr:tyrosine--tRNA ligase [Paracoccaceae bacterium]
MKSNLLNNLQNRGFINDCTDLPGLDDLLKQTKITCYIGYDATASSLHVGHLMNIMMLRWFQKDGHRVITLLGGGTTKIGDPSFRKTERPLMNNDTIHTNLVSLKSIFSKYINFSSDFPDALMLNNDEWLSKLNYLEFLRDTGKHFSINRMLSFESVKSRLQKNDPLSFLEFNYMILQGYDFYKLNEDHECILQMGGSDQWGNIVSGIELTRRMSGNKLFGLTSPLLTNSAGQKMGKSLSGAIWLNEENLSPYEFWQFWRNCEDNDIEKFLLLFTEVSNEKIKELTARQGHYLNEAKIILANEVTNLCHGKIKAADAFKTSQAVFNENIGSDKLPTIEISKKDCPKTISIIQLLTMSGMVRSGKEARRLIADKAVKLEGKLIDDISNNYETKYFLDPQKLSIGKKKHFNIVII